MAKGVKPDTYEGTQEEWDEVMSYCSKMARSMMNDFFDGEEALVLEQKYRYLMEKPLLTKEEVQERTEKWVQKEKEIWNAGDTELHLSKRTHISEGIEQGSSQMPDLQKDV